MPTKQFCVELCQNSQNILCDNISDEKTESKLQEERANKGFDFANSAKTVWRWTCIKYSARILG